MVLLLVFFLLFVAVVFIYFQRTFGSEKLETTCKKTDTCCGKHAICERGLSVISQKQIVYYDDEELDVLSGIPPEKYTHEQLVYLSDVLYSLQANEVSGWLESLAMRQIVLPIELKNQAFMLVQNKGNI